MIPRAAFISSRGLSLSCRRAASTLVYLEHKGGKLNDSSLHALTAARTVDGDAAVIVVGSKADVDKVAAEAKTYILHHMNPTPTLSPKFLPSKSFTHLFAAHTAVGKNIFPRIAGSVDSSMIADIIGLGPSGEEFTRPIYAGNAILKIKSSPKDKIKVITVRTTAFDKAAIGNGSASLEAVDAVFTDTPRVVSGGRALKSQENFGKVLDPLADALHAAVGASRAAVDAGYADNSLQVGQSGKVVAPELYVAVGISGAIQHLAGMKESKMIVAINKDADAPIFQIADVGLVADLFEAVPELAGKVA
ncbi:MAG: Electron transfer flavoprotein alpha-subunit [Tremellales sp. Tagirdzhanova-0007]|nr:MAG: Electron transfer flavoprotein alpha-subunit [Tremellales sp. Tagirdzhanova-0007]